MTLYPDVVMVVTIILCGISNSWHTPKPCNLEEDIKKYIDKCNTAVLFSPLGWDIERYYSILVLFHEKNGNKCIGKGGVWVLNGFVIFHEPFLAQVIYFQIEFTVCWRKLNLFKRILSVIIQLSFFTYFKEKFILLVNILQCLISCLIIRIGIKCL